jgi:hypothetical protein
MAFTFAEMLNYATEAFGPLGFNAVKTWSAYNKRFFGNTLRPIPLIITQAQPFGRRAAFCSFSRSSAGKELGRTITLNAPSDHNVLVADRGTLLHEMIHQFLFERGADPTHTGWRHEIMRLDHMLTGEQIWAGPSRTMRIEGKVVRRNMGHEDGRVSLSQGEIARWPHCRPGIELGALGS